MVAKRTEIQMLSDFMQGVNTMIDASSQLIHQRDNSSMKWMAVRDMLNIIRNGAKAAVKDGLNG